MIQWSADISDYQGIILGDAMGNGKTLETLLPLIHDRNLARSRGICPAPDVVVAPPALVRQWESEIHKYFGDVSITDTFHPGSLLTDYL